MSYIRIKSNKNGKKYAYEVTSTWDKAKKQPRSSTRYLGAVNEQGDVLPKGEKVLQRGNGRQERLIVDFGNGYLVEQAIKQAGIFAPLQQVFAQLSDLLPLMIYRFCQPGAMYNADTWLQGNVASLLYKSAQLTSQRVSELLQALGQADLQRAFFLRYLQEQAPKQKQVVIDATSLPNEINVPYTEWGKSAEELQKQFRFHCVLEATTQTPLYYRLLPGSITDVSTLQNTLEELKEMEVVCKFVVLDAGYASQANIAQLYAQKTHFLTRLPKSRTICQEALQKALPYLRRSEGSVSYQGRRLFIKRQKVLFAGEKGYIYVVLDPVKWANEVSRVGGQRGALEEKQLKEAGIFTLASSLPIASQELLHNYYMRQSIERAFSWSKSDLDLLPIRCHKEETINGYLFLSFLLLAVYVHLHKKLKGAFTVEQALMHTQQLKGKVFADKLLVSELTKKQKRVFERCDIIVPTSLGI